MTGRRTMWAAAMMTHPLQDRLDAMQAAGLTHMSVFPIDMRTWYANGMTDAQIGGAIRDAGINILALDPFTGWAPGWSVDGLDDDTRAFIDYSEDDVWRMADALDAEKINCVHSVGSDFDLNAYGDALGAFANRAQAHGRGVALEFMPISQVPDLATGWKLAQHAGDKVGLIFDTWHFWRSDPDHTLLATIPGDRIKEVQLADARTDVVEDLMTDLMRHRVVPGEGDFDLQTTIEVLSRIGGLSSVGPETFSDEMNGLGAEKAVSRNAQAVAKLMARVPDK